MAKRVRNLSNTRTVGAADLIPKAGQVDYWDRDLKGWGLRVSTSGRRTWFVMYRADGRRERFTLGTYPAMGAADAREKALGVLRSLANGDNPAQAKRTGKLVDTFAELAEGYIRYYAKGEKLATWEDGRKICEANPGFKLVGRKLVTPAGYSPDDLKENDRAIRAFLAAPETPPAPNKRSWRKDQDVIDRDLLPEWRYRKADSITRLDVNRVLDKIVGRGSSVQANRVLEIIRVMYSWAIGTSRVEIHVNPCHEVKKRHKEKSKERHLSTDEIPLFWPMAGNAEHPAKITEASKLALRLILATAQRPGEVLGMRKAELDANWETSNDPGWTIPGERVKNGRTHRIPLSPLALDLLREAVALSGESPFVFPSPRGNGPMLVSSLSHAIARSQFFGLEPFTPHDLRRTASTLMGRKECGVRPHIVSRVLNHIDQTVRAKHYDPYDYDDEKREAMNAWSRRLAELIEGGASVVSLERGA
tara:strand:+ start:658 stop:2085 length:1428 start_codon:yes stop_codon:yes gene_type:complete